MATRIGKGLCETCYYRLRRTGRTEPREIVGRYRTAAGYIKLKRPMHPLADGDGCVFEHRFVVWGEVGPENQKCYWCDALVSWSQLVIDHLDDDKENNDITNLVVACNNCNRARGAMLPFIRGMTPGKFDKFIEVMRPHIKTGSGQ